MTVIAILVDAGDQAEQLVGEQGREAAAVTLVISIGIRSARWALPWCWR
jgi:hypothetical protein